MAQALDVNNCLILELLQDGETLLPRAGIGWSRGFLQQTAWNVPRDSPSVGSLLAESSVAVENFCLPERYDGPERLLYHGVTSGLTVLIRHDERPFGVLGVYSKTPRVFDKDEIHFLDEIAFVITLAIQRKATELRRREQETLRAEHLANVAQMATGVAHELRNPLTAVKMLVQTGRDGGPGGMPAEDLEYIEQEIRRMERWLQSYLDFARPRKPERREMDLAGLVDRTLALVQPRAVRQHVELRFARPASAAVANVDWEQIRQVLINLAFNALDAMPRGGTLETEFQTHESGTIALRVLDTGPGMTPQVQTQMFQPFFTSKETGTGLGLVISRRIAKEHGGSLTATAIRSVQQPASAGAAVTPAEADDWDRFLAERLNSGAKDLYAEWSRIADRYLLERVLAHTAGNLSRASEILGLNRRTLRETLQSPHLRSPLTMLQDGLPNHPEFMDGLANRPTSWTTTRCAERPTWSRDWSQTPSGSTTPSAGLCCASGNGRPTQLSSNVRSTWSHERSGPIFTPASVPTGGNSMKPPWRRFRPASRWRRTKPNVSTTAA
jgi:signal transduction histidine kinase